jgi:hypothetical protein
MYSEIVIHRTLDDFAAREGWRPEPHSVDQVSEFTEYIDSLMDVSSNARGRTIWWKDGKCPTEARQKWIRRWIENEQFLCFADASYFATRYAHIRLADERVVRFDPRLAQIIIHQALAECDEKQVAIQLFLLKARQLGCSTVVAIYFLHRILFRPNTYAVMASVQHQQSDKLQGMIDLVWDKIPWWLPPPKTILKRKDPKWANGSKLSIQAGSQEVGIAQGDSPSCIHISELGDYANPKRVLEEGLFPACHPTRSLFMVLEGTGATSTPWQKEKWDFYTANWGKGGRFQPFFIPPACAHDLYPHEDWLRAHPIPAGWEPPEETRRMRRRGELFVRSTDYLRKVLGQRWEMDKEFQWYWTCLYQEAIASHSEREFLSQFAATPDDAFQSENAPVFSREVIEVVTKEAKVPYKAYAITGRTIIIGDENRPYRPPEGDIDWTEPNIKLNWEAQDGNEYEWELVPLKSFDDSKDELCFDKLLIFEPPEDGAEYAIAIDTAHGLNTPNEDRTSLNVVLSGRGTQADRNVASFTSIRVNSPQMARIAAAIAVLFTTDGNGNITSGNPLLCRFVIEQVRKAGDECQHQLKIMGFLDHHPMHRYDGAGNVVQTKVTKEGWFTQPWSRPILIDRFTEAVNTGWLEIRDPVAVHQLPDFVRKYKGQEGKPFCEHTEGAHDDDLMSLAMAWTTLHDMDNTALRIASKYKPPKKEIVQEDLWCERASIVMD